MNLNNIIKGDKVLLVYVMLLAMFSFLPVFSASSNLSHVVGGSSPIVYLFKHFIILLFGFVLMLSIQKIPFKNFRWISILLLLVQQSRLHYLQPHNRVLHSRLAVAVVFHNSNSYSRVLVVVVVDSIDIVDKD